MITGCLIPAQTGEKEKTPASGVFQKYW